MEEKSGEETGQSHNQASMVKKFLLLWMGIVCVIIMAIIGKAVTQKRRAWPQPVITPTVAVATPTIVPAKWKVKANLKTSKGQVEIANMEVEADNEANAGEIAKNRMTEKWVASANYLFWITNGRLHQYQKGTRIYATYNLIGYPTPNLKEQTDEAVKEEEKRRVVGALWPEVEEISPSLVLIKMVNLTLPFSPEPYILNVVSKQFWLEKGLKCGGYSCGGPSLEGQISETVFVFRSGSGDACWNAGQVWLYDTQARKAKLLMSYGRGCTDDEFYYLGMAQKKLVIAKRKIVGTDYWREGEVFLSLHTTDPLTGKVDTILAEDKMPAKSKDVRLAADIVIIVDEAKRGYGLDLKTNTLKAPFPTPTPKPDVPWRTPQEVERDEVREYLRESPDVIEIKIERLK